MITREQAERIADEIIGQREGWELVEFNEGWLILAASAKDHTHRGGATPVIERSGRVLEFPSYVPPTRILDEYADVVRDGIPLPR